MKSPGSTYLITRVHGLKTHLIKHEDFDAMIKAKGLKEVIEILLKTEYADQISMIPEKNLDASTLEKIFLKKLVERAYFILKASPQKIRDLLVEYYRRFEVENIKRILRSKHVDEPIEEGSLIPLEREYSTVNFPALLAAKDVQEVADLLRETIYSSILEKLELYHNYKTPMILEAYLDNLYYGRLWEKLDKTVSDKDVRQFFTIEIDFRNLLLVLGMKIREVDASFIEENIISVGDGVSKRKLSSLIKAKIEEAPQIIPNVQYKKILIETIELFNKNLFAELEIMFNSYKYEIVSKAFLRRQFDIGYVFLYIYFCESEAKNLVAISLCKELGMSEEEVKKIVLM